VRFLRLVFAFFSNRPVAFYVGFEEKEHQMATGTIKRIVSERGFGFIAGADGTEYFFHRNSVENFDALRGDESVTFEAEDSPKGPRANQVRLSQAPAVSEG
jgi:CspA family cold shock protein